jgi:hypothetical protein
MSTNYGSKASNMHTSAWGSRPAAVNLFAPEGAGLHAGPRAPHAGPKPMSPNLGEAACMLQAYIRQYANQSTGDTMESGPSLASGTSGSSGSGKREGLPCVPSNGGRVDMRG